MSVPADEFVRSAELLKVVDGDTLRLNIDLGFETKLIHDVRLMGVDTPEPRRPESPAGQWVTKQVQSFFKDETELLIHSQVFRLGKFGRCLCKVWLGGECLNHFIHDNGLGWATDKSGKVIGPRDLNRLSLPDAIRRKCREIFT